MPSNLYLQRKFLRRINYKCSRSRLSYDNLLKKYNLLSLESRRLQLQSIVLYDICHGKYDCIALNNQLYYGVPFRIVSRREHKLFATKHCRTNAGRRSPMYRIVQSFNTYFNKIDITAVSLSEFRRCLMRHLLNSLKHSSDSVSDWMY